MLFTIAYYVISLCVNAGTRGFDQDGAPRARRRRGARPATRPWTSSCPSAASRSPCCATPGCTSSSSSAAYPGAATAYVLDDGAGRAGAAAWPRTSGSAGPARPDRGWMKKAGNLRHGFACSSGRVHPHPGRRLRARGPTCPPRCCPYFDADHVARHRPVPAVLPDPRAHVLDGTRRRRGPGAVLPAGAGFPGPARRRDLRGLVRDLPPRGAGGQRRHDADRALRGRAHRLRPAPGRLGPALHPGPAGRRAVPVRPGLLPHPAVPVVRRVDVAARLPEVLGHSDALADPALLPVRILLLRAHRAVHLRRPGDPAGHADLSCRSGSG